MSLLGDLLILVVVVGFLCAVVLGVIIVINLIVSRYEGGLDRFDAWLDRVTDRINDWFDRRKDKT